MYKIDNSGFLMFLMFSGFLMFLMFGVISPSCVCNSNTLHSILMILGRNVEQDKPTCRLQE